MGGGPSANEGSEGLAAPSSPPGGGGPIAARHMKLDEVVALRDALDDGMIDVMLRYMADCDLMGARLEEYFEAKQRDYDAVAANLREISWPARELSPGKLRVRLERADQIVRKMSPASAACRLNKRAAAVMRIQFYTP